MRKEVALSFFLTACGAFQDEDKKPKEATAQECLAKIQPVRDLYVQLLPSIADGDGWYETDRCDALLFNSLIAAGGVDSISIPLARDEDGAWFRRPAKDCYSSGGSKSSISRDMLLGVMFYATIAEEKGILEDLYNSGLSQSWVMGAGNISRTYFTPGLQSTLAEAIFYLGGPSFEERQYPQAWSTENVNFAAHLDVLHILLRGEIKGGVSEFMLQVLRKQYERSPRNPLFSFAYHKYHTGDYREALELLDNSDVWPKDRLPTTDNYCDEWYFQRDPGADWEPCPDRQKTHTGGELIFLTKLIERELGL